MNVSDATRISQVPAAAAKILVESPTLKAGEQIPAEHTADGRNTSPEVTWRNVPAAAKELVVAFESLDADSPFTRLPLSHWVVYRIPPGAKGLPAGLPGQMILVQPDDLLGACQAYTVFDVAGYRGPQPYPGQVNRFRLAVYALDADLNLKEGLFANFVLDQIKGHVIGEGEMLTTYQRQVK
jgi:Raf kinase inhibitor-like YbhB/YbcL family protein